MENEIILQLKEKYAANLTTGLEIFDLFRDTDRAFQDVLMHGREDDKKEAVEELERILKWLVDYNVTDYDFKYSYFYEEYDPEDTYYTTEWEEPNDTFLRYVDADKYEDRCKGMMYWSEFYKLLKDEFNVEAGFGKYDKQCNENMLIGGDENNALVVIYKK